MTISEYIASGILELYVLGMTDAAETAVIEQLAQENNLIKNEIKTISEALEMYAMANPVAPNPVIKPFVLATIDYTQRLQNGEPLNLPPVLTEGSKISDYAAWLDRPDMSLPGDFTDVHAKIIGYTPEVTAAIVWIKNMAPAEVHKHELETFLIVEGTCTITIGDEQHNLVAGDVLSIPLYKEHFVSVTSAIPCKVILQRMAA